MAEEDFENADDQIIVRAVTDDQPTSKVEQERKFIKEEEDKRAAEDAAAEAAKQQELEAAKAAEEQSRVEELDDNSVLSYIKNKYNKDVTSFDDLLKEPEVRVEKEEIEFDDVKAFLQYKKETGRGLEDFIRLNKDLTKEDPNKILADFYRDSEDMDDEDLSYQMKKFSYDEDIDSEEEIAAKKHAYKKELKKAVKHFEGLKEKYKAPLESRGDLIPESKKADYEAFKAYEEASVKDREVAAQRSKVFAEKTESLFSDKFEGFGFEIDENTKLSFKPADAETLKKQSNIQNFISKFLDDNGLLKGDGSEFHKAIAMASDPDKAAKFFYEKGVADAIEKLEREGKNIELRSGAQPNTSDGIQVRVLDDRPSSTFKFRKQ